MWIVVDTNNISEKGKAYMYNKKEDGIDKIKELYKYYTKTLFLIDRDNTYINKNFTYAQVSDGLRVNELRLITC